MDCTLFFARNRSVGLDISSFHSTVHFYFFRCLDYGYIWRESKTSFLPFDEPVKSIVFDFTED